MPTSARPRARAALFAPLALAFAGLLADEEADAVARPGWAFAGWEGLAFDDRRAAAPRRLTRPRLLAGARLAVAWLGPTGAPDPAELVAEVTPCLGLTLEQALARAGDRP
jgi:hypothetical protein